jgi:HlyD family secretion protein
MKKNALRCLVAALLLSSTGCAEIESLVAPANAPTPEGGQQSSPASASDLRLAGALEADSANVAAEISAPIVEIAVREGDAVRAGQILIRLDDTLLQAQRAQAEAAVNTARAALALAQAGPRANAVQAAQAEVARAQAELAGARQAVSDTRRLVANPPGLDTQLAQADAQIKLAEQAVIRATAELEEQRAIRDKTPFNSVERGINDQKVLAAEATLAAAQADLAGAQKYHAELQRIRRAPAELIVNANTAAAQAVVAEARLGLAEATLALTQAGPAAEDVAIAQADVDVAQANLALLDAQWTRYTLTAPMDGVVTQKIALPGEVAQAGTPLLVVSDPRVLKVKVYVNVGDMGRVAVGQRVTLSTPAYPDETFAGEVAQIAGEAEFTPSNVQTAEGRAGLVFAVTIRAPNADGRLKAGMPVEVAIGPA